MPTPKGNISVIVLFILTVSSLLGMLAMHNVKDVIGMTTRTKEFAQSVAFARAGVQLGLLIDQEFEPGFETSLPLTGSLSANFLCHQHTDCGFTLHIRNRVKADHYITPGGVASQCTSDNSFRLEQGESTLFPLFYDARTVDTKNSTDASGSSGESFLSEIDDATIQLSFIEEEMGNIENIDLIMGVLAGEEQENYQGAMIETKNICVDCNTGTQALTDFLGEAQDSLRINNNQRNFFFISYPTYCPPNSKDPTQILDMDEKNFGCECFGEKKYNEEKNICESEEPFTKNEKSNIPPTELSFCFKITDNAGDFPGVPTSYTSIDSIGQFAHTQSSLQAKRFIQLPIWLINTAIEQ